MRVSNFVFTTPAGVKLAGRTLGPTNAPAALLVSGQGNTLNQWRGLDRRLSEAGFRVITFDNRDMGLSSRFPIPMGQMPVAPSDESDDAYGQQAVAFYTEQQRKHGAREPFAWPYTLDNMADDCVAVLDHLKLGTAHVLGFSLGGAIAQICAVRHRPRVQSLTAIMTAADLNGWTGRAFAASPDFFMDIITRPQVTRGMSRDAFLSNRLDVWRRILIDDAHPELAGEEEELLLAELGADFDRDGVDWLGLGASRQTLAMCKWSTDGLSEHLVGLAKLDLPTLVLHGVHDPIVPVAGGRELADMVPGAHFFEYAGGHNMPLDQQGCMAGHIVDLWQLKEV